MKILLVLLLMLANGCVLSQDKVIWTLNFSNEKKVLEITADIAEGWHLYSQHINPEIGPIPTQFKFSENNSVEIIGKTIEGNPIEKFDENFEAKLTFFEGKSVFNQAINLKATTVLELQVTFMVCNDKMCLPPVEKLMSIELKKKI
jgi:hypothetical protein